MKFNFRTYVFNDAYTLPLLSKMLYILKGMLPGLFTNILTNFWCHYTPYQWNRPGLVEQQQNKIESFIYSWHFNYDYITQRKYDFETYVKT